MMIKAILFDLDNTLLGNANAVFVPQYLRLADAFFREQWQFDDMPRVLRQVARAMSGPRDPRQTNTELAEDIIAHMTRRPVADVQATFALFYDQVYPQLRHCVEQVPLAATVIERARSQGLTVVIATNPLYPETAIQQRLAWAGLADDFAFVTHSDNMHLAKPDPAYYAEVIARVGIEPDEALMIGDSYENDIQPTAMLGLATFHVAPSQPGHVGSSSTLADFDRLLATDDWLERWQPRPLLPQAIEPQYQGNLAALFGMLADVKPHHWHQRPDPNEWSIMQTLCHLLESEEVVHRPRLQRILAEDNPFLAAPKPALRDTPPCADDGYQIAERFLELRRATITWLHSLQPQDWPRPARHSIFGPTTLLEMAQFTAQHDRLHISQICQTLGKCAP